MKRETGQEELRRVHESREEERRAQEAREEQRRAQEARGGAEESAGGA